MWTGSSHWGGVGGGVGNRRPGSYIPFVPMGSVMGFVQIFGSRHSIPAVLDGSDVLVTAQTGSAFRRFWPCFFSVGRF